MSGDGDPTTRPPQQVGPSAHASFDRHSGTYGSDVQRSISFIGQSHDFFVRSKVQHLVRLATRFVGEPPKLDILDVGCGVGITAEYLAGEFKSVYGVDVSKESIAAAKERHSAATYQVYDGEVLPFSDGSFDLSFAIGVLHHVPSSARSQLLSEMRRATRPGGLVVVFEHNPFNPLTRLAVRRCDFDKDCVLVSKKVTSQLFRQNDLSPAEESYILFLPWSIPWTARLEAVIRNVPLGAQYLVAARRAG